MATAGFNEKVIDLHSGGEDLKFPHHDNEMAQSHACFKEKVWTRYFIHSGHLNIKGEKMSKSTKNFTTIKVALNEVGANTLRLYYAQTSYNKKMNFDPENRYTQAEIIENTFKNFFRNCESYLRDFDEQLVNLDQKFDNGDMEMLKKVSEAKNRIDDAFKDNFNTPNVLLILQDLVNKINCYINQKKENLRHLVLKKAIDFVRQTLFSMGMDYTSNSKSTANDSIEDDLLNIITNYRNDVRRLLSEKKINEIFKLNDLIRDEHLFNLGIKINDEGQNSVWLKCSRVELEKEQRTKEQMKVQKLKAKNKKQELALAKMKIKPEEMFKTIPKFAGGTFDEKGCPLLTKDGKDYSKMDKKYIQKQWKKQKGLYDQYLASSKDI